MEFKYISFCKLFFGRFMHSLCENETINSYVRKAYCILTKEIVIASCLTWIIT